MRLKPIRFWPNMETKTKQLLMKNNVEIFSKKKDMIILLKRYVNMELAKNFGSILVRDTEFVQMNF